MKNIAALSILFFIGLLQFWSEPIFAQSIESQSERARNILCNLSICPHSNIAVRIENYKGYNGYYHLNEGYISVLPSQSSLGVLMTLVHEYTHVYRSEFNKHEETWLSEGLAKLVEYKVSTVWPESYQRKLKVKPWLVYENSERRYGVNGDGYSDSFWLVYYLYQHFGGDQFLNKILQSELSGWSNVLGAITELQASGVIAKNTSIINQDAILRHFALAMLLNDQFAAKYSLFFMGPDYTPLSSSGFTESSLKDLTTGPNRQIIYSKIAADSRAREKYVVKSLNPLVIEPVRASGTDKGLYYISIF